MRASFPPSRRGRDAARNLARTTGLFALAITGCAVAFQVVAALVGATLAALGMNPYSASGWADLAGILTIGLVLVALYLRRWL